jgi:hypothetical protein
MIAGQGHDVSGWVVWEGGGLNKPKTGLKSLRGVLSGAAALSLFAPRSCQCRLTVGGVTGRQWAKACFD